MFYAFEQFLLIPVSDLFMHHHLGGPSTVLFLFRLKAF